MFCSLNVELYFCYKILLLVLSYWSIIHNYQLKMLNAFYEKWKTIS